MRSKARLVKLEARQQKVNEQVGEGNEHEGEDPLPRVSGKPHHVALAEYADWLQRRLADKGRSDDNRQSIRQRIGELAPRIQKEREAYQATCAKPAAAAT